METKTCPILKGEMLFRKDELVYINKSDEEFQTYMNFVHRHDFIEIVYALSGYGKHIVGGKEYEISRGDLFIINNDIPHGFFPIEKGKNEPVVYNCVFMPEFLDTSLFSSNLFQDIGSSFLFKSLFNEDFSPDPDLNLQGTDFKEIGKLFNKMYLEYKSMRRGYCDIIRAYLIELIVKIFRYMDIDRQREISSKNRQLVSEAIEYLKVRYSTDIKLEEVAIKSFLSKNYFSKLFKEVTGTSFSEYIQELRIGQACSLLKNTDMKVNDIASQCGFNDIKFFYEVFKKFTGTTPGAFRREC